ncbi:MAG: alpha/beta hydrolase [Burkholderiales bacterium]|nr:alpha/beta hydrolase [Burkholderiales bacterium]MDE2299351.1 alpha/beta hydrolase [Burkholderiales bacterium]MDE2627806.1 alpha/beta hydrolase [Burkholderiales bacterium]
MCLAAAPGNIVFAHANGFPAGTYRQLFEAWRAAGFAVHAIEKFGHDPRFPVTSNWPHLRDQLIHFVDAEVGAPAFLVGHSLGGYLSLMAASRRPDLARGVVLLDSPVLSGWKAHAVQVAKAAGVGERFLPARVSRRRRQHWDSQEAAYAHFAAKPAFARWAPGVLRDYIAAGTETHGTTRRLSFEREVETAIYNALPHHLSRVLRAHPLRCPMAFVQGTESDEVRRVGMAATRRLAQGRVTSIEGSHLFPFERPLETAATVLQLIETLRVDARTPRL